MKTLFILFVVFCLAPALIAQPCEPSVPPVISIGTSACLQVCPGSQVSLILEGNQIGPGAVPILIMEAGCQTLHCDVTCNPIQPPPLVLGSDPSRPDDYHGANDCVSIYVYFTHTNVWTFSVFSNCSGCFCVTFDRQLAVELLGFSAVPGDGEVELRWTVATETGNDYYEVRRGGETVGTVDALNSPTQSQYSWTERALTNGRSYHYALTAVDLHGLRTELSTLDATPGVHGTAVTEYSLHQNYPNPFNAQTSIAFDLIEAGWARLTVFDMTGRAVMILANGQQVAGRHEVNFDASHLPTGMYLYRLEAENFVTQKKLLLLK